MQVAQRASLLSTHDSLDGCFATMVRAAQAGDWLTCDEYSEMFAIALDVHLRHEEAVQFPRYEATSAAAAAEVEQFLVQHVQIRRAVGRLLAGFQQRVIDTSTLATIELLLREHDAHESTRFLPWLQTFGRC